MADHGSLRRGSEAQLFLCRVWRVSRLPDVTGCVPVWSPAPSEKRERAKLGRPSQAAKFVAALTTYDDLIFPHILSCS